MPKDTYICTMTNAKIKGVYLRGKVYYRNINIRLSNGKYTKQYFCLDTSDIKIAETRNKELSLNEDKIKSGLDFVPTWQSNTGTFRFKSYEFGYLSKKFMEYKRGEGLTKGSLDFYRIAFESLLDIQNYFESSWKEDLDMTRMNDEHIEDIKKYYMLRVDAMENSIPEIKGLKRATVHIRYRSLRTFFDWLVEKEIIKRSPKLVIKGIPPKPPKYFSDTEMDLICNHIMKSKEHDSFLSDVFRFYAETGLRLSEPFHAELKGSILTVGKTKGDAGRGRKVALQSQQTDVFKALRQKTHIGTAQDTINKKTHHKHHYSKKFNKIITELGIKHDRSFHNLRDTFVTKTWFLTKDIHLTSKLVGHSTVSMTEKYCGFHPEELANDFPSVLRQREEKEKIFQAMKDFELNPWKYTD